jgi:hypothetical protein
MTTTFGPQLIGETEKTLNAILRRALTDTGLTEPQWVTLRIASQNDASAPLADLVADRAHLPDVGELIAGLTARALLDGHRLSRAGRELADGVQRRITEMTRPIWDGLDAHDTAATERTLNSVITRGRAVLEHTTGADPT